MGGRISVKWVAESREIRRKDLAMIRMNTSGFSRIVRLVQNVMTTMRAPFGTCLISSFGIKINKRGKKDGIGNKKMGHWNKFLSVRTQRLA